MFGKIMEALKNYGSKPPFDASVFNDPVALKTEWGPCKRGGANFRTHKLKLEFPNRAVFKPTGGAAVFYAVFLVLGLVFMGFGILKGINAGNMFNDDSIVIIGISSIFVAIGAVLIFFGMRPVVFDKTTGYFWKGFGEPDLYSLNNPKSNTVSFSEIYSLQIISELVRSNKSSYMSYELNLVLKDGNRKNVIDHGKLSKLREDGRNLAEFLNVPLWER